MFISGFIPFDFIVFYTYVYYGNKTAFEYFFKDLNRREIAKAITRNTLAICDRPNVHEILEEHSEFESLFNFRV